MLSKNNQELQRQKGAAQRQHFGLRKLNIGVASVLLGTSLLWWAGAKPVQAATKAAPAEAPASQPTSAQPTKTKVVNLGQSPKSVSTDSVTAPVTSKQDQQAAPVATPTSAGAGAATTTSGPASSATTAPGKSNDAVSTEKPAPALAKPTTQATPGSVAAAPGKVAPAAPAANQAPKQDPASSADQSAPVANPSAPTLIPQVLVTVDSPASTPEQATLSTGTSITINQSPIGAINGSGDLVITLNVPNYQAGTVVTLNVPSGYYYGPDGSQNLPAGIGTTTITPSDPTADTNAPGPWVWVITNTYTSDVNGGGGSSQQFVFKRYNNGKGLPTLMDQIGLVDKTVTLAQTDPGQKPESVPLKFQQYTNPEMAPSMKLVRPNSSLTQPLTPNTTYVYEVDVNETTGVDYGSSYASKRVNNAVNSGTTITIPVPQGFLLDQALTSQINGFTDQTTISQPGGVGSDIIITVPKGSGNQNYQAQDQHGYQLAGQYQLPTPQSDTTYTAKGQITVDQQVQYADGTMHQLTGTIAPWAVTIQGDTNQGDYPALNISGVGYNNQTTGTLPVNANPQQPLLTFNIDNPSSLNVTNGQVTFDIPDGLAITRVTTPVSPANLPGTTSYQWQATLANGTTANGTVNAGEAITTDEAIKTLVVMPNQLEPGATTTNVSFKFYGTVDKSLADGTNLKATGKTQYTVNGKTYFKTAEVNQAVSQPTAGEGAWFNQSSNQPGTQAGFMSVYSTYGNPNSNQIYEPIFYYVIPKGFSYDATKGLTNLNGTQSGNVSANPVTPKVSTFVVDGQEVVKLDYTGTGYNFMTGGNANNWIYLNISQLATPGTNYRAAIYVVSPTTKLTNQAATSDPNFNPAYTQGQTADAYLVGTKNYTVSTAQVVSVASAAQGNLNTVPETKGQSDDKGKPAMSFQTRVQNNSNKAMNDGILVINLTQGGTSFQLTGPVTGLSADATVTYSTTVQPAPGSTTGAQPDLTGYVGADQVTDWSKIQSVAIHLGTIAANSYSPIITLNGTDPTLAQDAGKTVGITTQMYTTNLAPITGKQTDNAQITVSGKSTVTSQYSYVDDQGKTQTIAIPGLSYTYTDNKDTALTQAKAMTNLTAQAKALIPDGYVLGDVQLLAPTAKSWQTDAPIGTPEFGKTVQYFYNNAIVQYNLVKVYSTDAQTKDVTRTVQYWDKSSGDVFTEIPDTVAKSVKQTATVTQYAVKDASGQLLGYNTSGTWTGGVYTPSKDANGQIKVDTTDANASWMSNGSKWDQVTNPDLSSHGYNGPFEADGTTPDPTVAENTNPTADSTVKVYYTENVVDVSTPSTTTDTVPGSDTHFAKEILGSDLTKTITRTINVYDQNGKPVTDLERSQDVTFTRSAKVNAVTGKVVGYTDWASANSTFDAYAPTLGAGQGIQSITDRGFFPYSGVTKDSNGKLTGIDQEMISSTANSGEIVNIYLNQAKTFTGTETVTYNTYDKDGNLVGTPTTDSKTATVSGTQYYEPMMGNVQYHFDDPTAIYPSVTVAPKTGYYASVSQVPEVTKTISTTDPQDSDLNATATVDYKPMGQVIQVDQDGNQIPGTTPVTYKNNSSDPTKAGETNIPSAPAGWILVTPGQTSVTPTDPGADTKVVYEPLNTVTQNKETVTRTINYVDQTTDQSMPTDLAPTVTQNVTLTQYEVKDSAGKVIGYNTTGTWTDGKYTPSTEANGQIKIDTTNAADSWMNSDGSKWDQVPNPDLTKLGYVGPSAPTIAEVTPTTSTTNTTETVYYTEKTVTVTPDKPKTTSDTIEGTDVKYPTGVDESDLNKTVTRTVTIVNPDGTKTTTPQTFKFTRNATVNAVTGNVTYGAWNEPSHQFGSVTVPSITGYTPSGDVPAITVTPDSENSDVTITYIANEQTAKITFFDDTTGKTIMSETASGKFGQPIVFSTNPSSKLVDLYTSGYEFVSNNFSGQKYQADNAKNNFEIHLKEMMVTVTPNDPKMTDDTIKDTHVKYPVGVGENDLNKTITRTINVYDENGNLVAKEPQTVKYTRTATVNAVTGKVDYADWTSTDNTLGAYAPTLGADQGIQSITDGNGTAYANVTKDANGKLTGVDQEIISNTATSANDETVNVYLNQAKTFTGTETITYNTTDQDGNKTSETKTQPATVSGTQYYDPATKQVTYSFDTPNATYPAVNVPIKDGYYASAGTVPAKTVAINTTNPQDSDLNTTATVDYKPMGQVIQVDQEGKQITGTTPTTYPNDPNDPTKAGQVTVPSAPAGWVIVDPSKGQPFTPADAGVNTKVVYEPLDQINATTETVTRTINYVDKTTGQPMPNDLAPSITQSVTLTNYEVKDSNGKVLGYNTTGTWKGDQYTPSKEANGQIKVDTTDRDQSWMNPDGTKWDAVTNPDLSSHGYNGPFAADGTTADPTIDEVTPSTTTANTTETVYYTEKVVTVTPDKPKTTADTIEGTEVKYPKGVSESDLNKTVTRTVTIVNPDGTKTITSQTFKFTRSATVNAVTGKVTYEAWNEESHNFDSVAVPTVPGYTPSGDVPALTVTPSSSNSEVTITYTAKDQSTKIQYVTKDGKPAAQPDGTLIPDVTVGGKTGETVSVTDEINGGIPTGWELVPGQDLPKDVTFGPDGYPNIPVQIQHKTNQVTHDQPVPEGATTPTGVPVKGAHESDLNQTITRTINVTTPDGKTTTMTQTATITRDASYDDVTGDVTYGQWTTDSTSWTDFKPTEIPGYTASQTDIPAVTVKDGDKDETVNITYTANPESVNVIFKDKQGNQIGETQTVTGVMNGTVNTTTTKIPAGWVIVGKDPRTPNYKLGTHNPDIVVTIEHGTQQLADETKTVTRTINVHMPDGTTKTVVQAAHFTRTATKDLVTGVVTYGAWNNDQSWPGYTVPTINGYVPSQTTVAEQTVTADDKDQTIDITYEQIPNPGQGSGAPSEVPSGAPSQAPSGTPSQAPSETPSGTPSQVPSETPSGTPSQAPSETPSGTPSQAPSETPSQAPSETPSGTPSQAPSGTPSQAPSETPSGTPSQAPSETPSGTPSQAPSETPSGTPSQAPSETPSGATSQAPSGTPSEVPSQTPGTGTGVMPSGQPEDGSGPSLNQSGKVGLTTAAMTKAPGAAQKRLPQTGNDDQRATAIAGLSLMGVVASLLGMGKRRKHEN